MKTEKDDTICAISTPPGEAGIGIVRISGHSAYKILKKIFRPKAKTGEFLSRKFYLGRIVDPRTERAVDEVLAVYMKAPKTYTREDVVEIHSHGGSYVQQRILSIILNEGARLAEPGEFTKRAFLNGRIDLLQAESVLAIIQSESERELDCALAQLDGRLSKKMGMIKEEIKTALALVEAQIDFPEEDVDIDHAEIKSRIERVRKEVSYLLDSYSTGRIIKEGYLVLIVGRTNVGKSSLLNEIVLKEKAIVTPLPGTTRDLIEDVVIIKGIKVKIVDTAGIRDPRDMVEREGIERVRRMIPEADLLLWVVDGSEGLLIEDIKIYEEIKGFNVLCVINKIDLNERVDIDFFMDKGLSYVKTSALTGEGISDLRDAIFKNLDRKSPKKGGFVITNARHRDILLKTNEFLGRAISLFDRNIHNELVAFELKEALSAIGEITGEVYSDEILEEIFSRFCIGK
ncbi:MAG: tRNA uridine-5-carboxymethylaminomethyl(34) synthesis GTPase MnmE [Deltaproteobacteria bacterium]|nr:tRNA uridine-5-carboxymethylaminomethyl(34) synthesis GTPase MnmE [Deltaproteobacteria bacterium]